ncbi:hypothetical protein [Paenibacillus fonticola]|uniref:hypothetical protein n=1 Tax=Paenibacillus fonticola TaxID=379896 RepID=UPI00036C6CB9|nr:hypothetical protein [Paenibacillus fonticola]
MKFFIHELEYVISFLYRLKLLDFSSRMRTRFIKILAERFQQYKEEYLDLVMEHCVLDGDGQPEIITEGEVQRYNIKDLQAFQTSLAPLLNEEFVVGITDNNRNMLKSVAYSVLHCGLEFAGDDQFKYDALAAKFEELNLDEF